MDIRPLVEAVMETAGKIKNDNMSDQDFYKFQFAAISRRGGGTPPYEQIGSIVVGAVSLSGMASSMRNTSLPISPIVQTTLYLHGGAVDAARWFQLRICITACPAPIGVLSVQWCLQEICCR